VVNGARPKPFMVYKNLDMMDIAPIQAVVKVTIYCNTMDALYVLVVSLPNSPRTSIHIKTRVYVEIKEFMIVEKYIKLTRLTSLKFVIT